VLRVGSSNGAENTADLSRAPSIGVGLMVVILIGLTLVAIYANIQKVRSDKIERATIIPISTATVTPSPGR
jgi:hypothetical protein